MKFLPSVSQYTVMFHLNSAIDVYLLAFPDPQPFDFVILCTCC